MGVGAWAGYLPKQIKTPVKATATKAIILNTASILKNYLNRMSTTTTNLTIKLWP